MVDINTLVRKYEFLQKKKKTFFYIFLAACVVVGALTKDSDDHRPSGGATR